MSQLIDGKLIAKTIENQLRRTIKKTGLKPKLAVVLVGNDKPSRVYVRRKAEAAARVGIDFALHLLPAKISKKKLIEKIIQIQKDKKLSGLIIQLPLPEPLYTTEVLNAVKPELDVDCLTDTNIGKLIMKTFSLLPPTPGAVLAILKWLKIKPEGKIITILGTGALVGKPLSVILANDGATVIACNSRTRNIKEKCLKADIIVTAVGKKRNLLTADMVKRGAIVIDTGIVFENGKMYGDVDFVNVQKKTSYITPVPGGVGPITVSLLLQNTLIAAKLKNKNLRN